MSPVEPFSLQTAVEAAKSNTLDNWVRDFLSSPASQNHGLLEAITLRRGFFVGPVMVPLRLCRPYPPFKQDNGRISAIVQLAPDDLGALPPILLRYRAEPARLDITDGHHRYRAFSKLGLETCYALIELGTEHIRE